MTTAKRKVASTVAAVGVAAALALGGTFAWQSISQTALNEASDVVNPGGRLHDDFYIDDNGDYNADVYVENFADDDIFARVQLQEFMEIVVNQGGAAERVVNVAGAKYLVDELGELSEAVTDKATDNTSGYEYEYVTHYFDQANTTDELWSWTMGSADSAEAYYMPTFNKNKDSIVADRNGMYVDRIGGISNRDQAQYQDADGNNTWTVWKDGDTKDDIEIYDADINGADEVKYDFENLQTYKDAGNIKTVAETHTAAPIGSTKGLISMGEWLSLNGGTYSVETHAGYWVYDADGWVYWSSPIEAGQTTGLLLDGIELKGVMDDTWYYAINVVAQFVTADDLGASDGTGFYDTSAGLPAPSPDAERLLKLIGVNADQFGSKFAVEVISHELDGEGGIAAYAGEAVTFAITDHEGSPVTTAERLSELGVTSSLQAEGSMGDAYSFTLNGDGTVTGQLPGNGNGAYAGSVVVGMTNPSTGETEQVAIPFTAQQDNRPTYTVKDPNYGTVFAQDIKPGASFDIFPGSYVSLSSSDSSTTWSDSSELSSVYGSPYGGVYFSVSSEEPVGTVIILTHTASDGNSYTINAQVVEQPASLTFNSKKFYETTENSVQCNQGSRYYYSTQNFADEVTLTLYDENDEVVSDAVDGSYVALPAGYDTSYTLVATDGASTVSVSIGIRDEYKLYLNGKSDYGWGEYVLRGETREFAVYKNDEYSSDLASGLTWTIDGAPSSASTKIDNGSLTIGTDETCGGFKLRAVGEHEGNSVSLSLSIYIAAEVKQPTLASDTRADITVPANTEKYIVPLDVFGFEDYESVEYPLANRDSGPNGLTHYLGTYNGEGVLAVHVDENNVSGGNTGVFSFTRPQSDVKLYVRIE